VLRVQPGRRLRALEIEGEPLLDPAQTRALREVVEQRLGVPGAVGRVAPRGHGDRPGGVALLAGGAFLLAADTLARTVVAPSELSVGVLTSFCGAPVFIWLLRSRAGRAAP